MSRLTSKIITVTYAGRDILTPGGRLNAESYGGSRSFTTTTEPLLNASAVEVREYGNVQGSMTLPICIDCASEPEAIMKAMDAVAHAEQHAVGTLSFKVGEMENKWQAGIQSLEWSCQYVGYGDSSRVRLTLTYSFTLGKQLS